MKPKCAKCNDLGSYHCGDQNTGVTYECDCRKIAISFDVPKVRDRANWLPSPHFLNLNRACTAINDALGGYGCYLVGSSLERRDYRDVDVRHILSDKEYDRLFHNEGGWTNPLWSLMCQAISLWLSQQSGLPIDFQIQRQTQANEAHKGRSRSALGIFLDYPGERPSDLKVPHGTAEEPK